MDDYYNHREQFLRAFGDVGFRDRLTLDYFAESNHTFTELRSQQALVEAVSRWAAVLKAIPTARFLLNGYLFKDAARRERITALLQAEGFTLHAHKPRHTDRGELKFIRA
jgi:hypothetical protein